MFVSIRIFIYLSTSQRYELHHSVQLRRRWWKALGKTSYNYH